MKLNTDYVRGYSYVTSDEQKKLDQIQKKHRREDFYA